MHRFYAPPAQCHDTSVCLTGPEAYHARCVLRVRRGEKVIVLDGAGREFLCEVEESRRDQTTLAVVERRCHPEPASCITLLQAVPKGKLMEAIIQKATELGVSRIVPLLTERVVARCDDKAAVHKTGKWQLVAREAIKQCGAPWLPKVEPLLTPAKFLALKETFELPLIASLASGSRSARECFKAFTAAHRRMPNSVCVWIGPEGDFAPAETEAIKAGGALPITLGPLVLRVETAALYCLSILNYELQVPPAGGFPVSLS